MDGTLFFSAADGVHGRELWKSDGSSKGTVMVKDIQPGGSSSPWSLTNVAGTLYFTAAADAHQAHELWESDGTKSGTTLVPGVAPEGESPDRLTGAGEDLFFFAGNSELRDALWVLPHA